MKNSSNLLLPGVFTVNKNGKKVRFSKGNLMANVNAEGTAVTEWKLADHQYDYVGDTQAQRECKGGLVDLFGWTPKGKYNDGVKQYGINTSTNDSNYIKDGVTDICCDWGSLIGDGMTLLSDEEWEYLIDNNRAINTDNKYPFNVAGIKGCILKPDGFTKTINDVYTAEEWATAEASGLVFIPFAGYRFGSDVNACGYGGDCWSSAPSEHFEDGAYDAYFDYGDSGVGDSGRYFAYSIRLVSVQ